MKNKWKIAFWCCLVVFIISVIIILFLSDFILEQQVKFRLYDYEHCEELKADFYEIINIINDTDLSYNEVMDLLKKSNLYYTYSKNYIWLANAMLIFENGKLKKIEKWKSCKCTRFN